MKNMLITSLQTQEYQDFEFIPVSARDHGFLNAADALNYGASLAKGGILVFAHQDVSFLNPRCLNELLIFCHNFNFGIAGVAGPGKSNGEGIYASVVHGSDRRAAGTRIISKPTPVASVDECLMFIKKASFAGFARIGETWHLYGVEYSLRCQERGENVYVFPIPIFHLSSGYSLNPNYFKTFAKVGRLHPQMQIIRTTCLTYKNDVFLPVRCFKSAFLWRVRHLFRIAKKRKTEK